MSLKTKHMLLLATALVTALIAGLFYAYSCSVNPGLARLPDGQYLAAMQAINDAILNPLFFGSFMGALFLLPVCTWAQAGTPRFGWLLAAAILYAVGVFGVTIAGNVPLNEALARFDVTTASAPEITRHRLAFEGPWLFFHGVRTIAAVACLLLVLMGCCGPFKNNG